MISARIAALGFVVGAVFALSACDPKDPYEVSRSSLASARAQFQTNIIDHSFKPDGQPAEPPQGVLKLVRYPAKDGNMAAYVTPDPRDGARHPAVIWLVGGYGGIGGPKENLFWSAQPRSNDQSGAAFRKAGIVTMMPSFRGENDNPGQYEMFYGEVDDIESARAWLAAQPYVDPQRIYLVGHSTGGTRALLASELNSHFRAVFSLGGVPDLKMRVEAGDMPVAVPFDQTQPDEFRLRSPMTFITSIRSPTFYFEGEQNYWDGFDEVQQVANNHAIPFHVFEIAGGDHFTIVAPVTEAIAQKILADSGEISNIAFDKADQKRMSAGVSRDEGVAK